MKIDIITIFPEMFAKVFEFGIISQAQKDSIIDIEVHDLRKWANNKHNQVDDRPFGGGPGMVLMPEPLFAAIIELKTKNTHVIFLSPHGKVLEQDKSEELSHKNHLILVCGRYEGIDQRVIDKLVDEEISVGKYVLSGGEIPAMVLVDTIVRLIPGAIKNSEFNDSESFSNPNDRDLLDFPQYTRPADFSGLKVPDVLLNGNHQEIAKWRKQNQMKYSTT